MILALDPGTTKTAHLTLEPHTNSILGKGILPNTDLRSLLYAWNNDPRYSVLAIEGMQSFGANIGRTVLDTCVWIGRFLEASKGRQVWPVFRPQVLIHHTGKMKGGDGAIRTAMIHRYGNSRSKLLQKGTSIRDKTCPLFGVTADVWSALAIASYVSDKLRKGEQPPAFPEAMTVALAEA